MFSFTASQAAARARGRTGQQSAAASSITGLSVQEAQQILNVTKLSPEEIQKVLFLRLFFLEIVLLLEPIVPNVGETYSYRITPAS